VVEPHRRVLAQTQTITQTACIACRHRLAGQLLSLTHSSAGGRAMLAKSKRAHAVACMQL